MGPGSKQRTETRASNACFRYSSFANRTKKRPVSLDETRLEGKAKDSHASVTACPGLILFGLASKLLMDFASNQSL